MCRFFAIVWLILFVAFLIGGQILVGPIMATQTSGGQALTSALSSDAEARQEATGHAANAVRYSEPLLRLEMAFFAFVASTIGSFGIFMLLALWAFFGKKSREVPDWKQPPGGAPAAQ